MGGLKNISMELFEELIKAIIPSKNLVEINFSNIIYSYMQYRG